jgi:hypothetical protein
MLSIYFIMLNLVSFSTRQVVIVLVSNTSNDLTGFQEWPTFHIFKRLVKKFVLLFLCSGSTTFLFVVIVITHTFGYMLLFIYFFYDNGI